MRVGESFGSDVGYDTSAATLLRGADMRPHISVCTLEARTRAEQVLLVLASSRIRGR